MGKKERPWETWLCYCTQREALQVPYQEARSRTFWGWNITPRPSAPRSHPPVRKVSISSLWVIFTMVLPEYVASVGSAPYDSNRRTISKWSFSTASWIGLGRREKKRSRRYTLTQELCKCIWKETPDFRPKLFIASNTINTAVNRLIVSFTRTALLPLSVFHSHTAQGRHFCCSYSWPSAFWGPVQ